MTESNEVPRARIIILFMSPNIPPIIPMIKAMDISVPITFKLMELLVSTNNNAIIPTKKPNH